MRRQIVCMALGLVVAMFASFDLQAAGASGGTAGTSSAASKPSANTAQIGGPFTLTDQNGKVVTEADFKGRYKLVIFGYTFCPDVCPTTLQGVSQMLDILGPDAEKVAPLFITVDPERDTAEVLKGYLSYFNPKIIGLTGSMAQIEAVAKAYQAPFSKDLAEDGDPRYYSMSHAAFIYLMGPDDEFLGVFMYQTPPEKMAKLVRKKFRKR